MNLMATLSSKQTALFMVGIILVVVSLFGLIGTLIALVIYKKTVEYTYESSRKLELVNSSPLFVKIKIFHKVSLHNKENKFLEPTFKILLRNYYNIFAERFVELADQTTKMFNANNYKPKPTIGNYLKAKKIFDNSYALQTDTVNIVNNIEQILEMQKIARDWYISVIEETNNIKTLIKAKNGISNDVWSRNSLNANFLYNLNSCIELAGAEIQNSKFNEAIANLKEAYEIISKLILIIDHTEKMIYLVDNQLKNKLDEIAKSIFQISTNNELQKNNRRSQFSSISDFYKNLSITIKREIYSLNIERAYENSETLLAQIRGFEINMKYETAIKQFIENSQKVIKNSFSSIQNEITSLYDIWSINKQFGNNVANINSIRTKILSVEQIIKEQNEKYANLLEEFAISETSFQKLLYAKQGSNLMDIISKIFLSFENLRVIRAQLTSKNEIINEIQSRNISLKKVLVVMEVLIAKNPNISILKTFQEHINTGFKILEKSEKNVKNNPELFYDRDKYDEMIQFLDAKIISFAIMKNDMASTIYLAKLSEVSLSYLNRFGGIESIDKSISKSLEKLQDENYIECLKDNVIILSKLNSKNIAIS
ncbi:hypothetical protein MENTO_v1c06320 [Mesoplasma entomophilum]|uniref:Septation ring formation regulator EzrA n=1 Tax=Mesoplasma entomophilum TaxID=2149 RepID=A0A3S5XZR3_9MOLU|nr:hypothetical protein [Mesoplasma entomophilum]ATQ35764.1 hypothetical protein CS528_03305 [Mesoplasma entomophilum]ATZ19733.1 hypothetical protein MENTO_v1c06320 [Mesoplasma entomophilum]